MRPLNLPHLSHLSSPPVSAPVPLKPNAPHLHGGVQQVFIWRTSKILKAGKNKEYVTGTIGSDHKIFYLVFFMCSASQHEGFCVKSRFIIHLANF